MTKRQQKLERIRIEIATEGKVTTHALRLYVENRISREAFQEAVEIGMRQYKEQI